MLRTKKEILETFLISTPSWKAKLLWRNHCLFFFFSERNTKARTHFLPYSLTPIASYWILAITVDLCILDIKNSVTKDKKIKFKCIPQIILFLNKCFYKKQNSRTIICMCVHIVPLSTFFFLLRNLKAMLFRAKKQE